MASAASLAGQAGPLRVVLAGLGWLEPDVLQQADAAVAQAAGHLGGRRPATSAASGTSCPSSSLRRLATGRRDGPPAARAAKSSPFGRPRCAQISTLAPRPASAVIVGRLALIRPSSVIVVPSSGTLRSARSSTLLPADVEVGDVPHGPLA